MVVGLTGLNLKRCSSVAAMRVTLMVAKDAP